MSARLGHSGVANTVKGASQTQGVRQVCRDEAI
jgi:hypothetical protein